MLIKNFSCLLLTKKSSNFFNDFKELSLGLYDGVFGLEFRQRVGVVPAIVVDALSRVLLRRVVLQLGEGQLAESAAAAGAATTFAAGLSVALNNFKFELVWLAA